MPAWLDRIGWAMEATQLTALRALNPLFFAARSRLRWRWRGYRESPIPNALGRTQRAMLSLPRAEELAHRYAINPLRPRLSSATWLTTLFFLDLLERAFAESRLLREMQIPAHANFLDIGSKNFDCAPALFHFFNRGGTGGAGSADDGGISRLTGVEIDAYRVYDNLHSRWDAAHYFLSLLPSPPGAPHRYIARDLREHQGQYDFVTWFHPFLDDFPLLHWGLPGRLLAPAELFHHALTLLRPGACLLIMNQEEHESAAQLRLIERTGWPGESLLPQLTFVPPGKQRYLHILRKPV